MQNNILLIGIRKNAKKIVVPIKQFFFNRKKILAFWYFANQSGIVLGTFSKNKKKIDFLVKNHHTLPVTEFFQKYSAIGKQLQKTSFINLQLLLLVRLKKNYISYIFYEKKIK